MNPGVVLLLVALQNGVNPDAAVVSQFLDRTSAYVKDTAKLKAGLAPLKPTDSRDAVTKREAELSLLIEQSRASAAQGDFFSPPVTQEFRRLIGIALKRHKTRVIKSLEHAEPVEAKLKVNRQYPPVPLQSTPPTLLANLPRLPAGLDYRVVGHALVLRDVQANLVLDFIPGALP